MLPPQNASQKNHHHPKTQFMPKSYCKQPHKMSKKNKIDKENYDFSSPPLQSPSKAADLTLFLDSQNRIEADTYSRIMLWFKLRNIKPGYPQAILEQTLYQCKDRILRELKNSNVANKPLISSTNESILNRRRQKINLQGKPPNS